MSFQSCVLDGLYTVRWGDNPEVVDFQRYPFELAKARIAQHKRLVGLFIVPEDSHIPDEQCRKAQAAKLPDIMANLEFAVAVFEGAGFVLSVKRSAFAAILLLAPKRYRIYVRPSVEDALLGHPPAPLPFHGGLALEELRTRGLC